MEYVTIEVIDGFVNAIAPTNEQTDSCKTEGGYGSLATVLNKLSAYDYELIPGVAVTSGSTSFLVMSRRKT